MRVLVSPFSEAPPERELALPQPEAPLEDGLVSPQLVESLVRVLVPPPPEEPPESVPVVTLAGDRRRVLVEEAPSEGEVLSPLKLLLNEVAVLGSFPLMPSWSRSKWCGLFLRAMRSKCYAGPYVVPLLTLLLALVAFCCRFASKS